MLWNAKLIESWDTIFIRQNDRIPGLTYFPPKDRGSAAPPAAGLPLLNGDPNLIRQDLWSSFHELYRGRRGLCLNVLHWSVGKHEEAASAKPESDRK